MDIRIDRGIDRNPKTKGGSRSPLRQNSYWTYNQLSYTIKIKCSIYILLCSSLCFLYSDDFTYDIIIDVVLNLDIAPDVSDMINLSLDTCRGTLDRM